jgi:hypothetical protein
MVDYAGDERKAHDQFELLWVGNSAASKNAAAEPPPARTMATRSYGALRGG